MSTILRSVRGTKQYWLARRNEVTCMIREFGPPSLFLTFSCAEYDSADITEYLKLVNGLSPDSNPNIAQLCTEDPVSVSRQFSSKLGILNMIAKLPTIGHCQRLFKVLRMQLNM